MRATKTYLPPLLYNILFPPLRKKKSIKKANVPAGFDLGWFKFTLRTLYRVHYETALFLNPRNPFYYVTEIITVINLILYFSY